MLNRWIENGAHGDPRGRRHRLHRFLAARAGTTHGRYLKDIPADSRAARGAIFEDQTKFATICRKSRRSAQISERRGQSFAQMAIAWVLRLPAVTSALLGASSVAQLEENLRALDHLEFASQELAEIESALRIETY